MKISAITSAVLMCTTLVSASAMAYDKGDMLLRAGITSVNPNDSSSGVTVESLGDVGMAAKVESNTQLGLNFVYFFDSHWALEVLAATPFKHSVKLADTSDNELGLGDGKLAEVKHLPPTVSAVYFFNNKDAAFQPYVGVGLNYTVFFDEQFVNSRTTQTFTDLELDSSFGLAYQAGVDFKLDENWSVNASVRYIDINTTANFKVLGLKGQVDVDIDPTVFSLMVGYKF